MILIVQNSYSVKINTWEIKKVVGCYMDYAKMWKKRNRENFLFSWNALSRVLKNSATENFRHISEAEVCENGSIKRWDGNPTPMRI